MGGSAKGLLKRGEREKKGWWEVREVGERDLPAGRAKRNVIQTPVMGGGGGVRARGQKDAEGGGEVERMTKQGEVDTSQIPKSRPPSSGSHSY